MTIVPSSGPRRTHAVRLGLLLTALGMLAMYALCGGSHLGVHAAAGAHAVAAITADADSTNPVLRSGQHHGAGSGPAAAQDSSTVLDSSVHGHDGAAHADMPMYLAILAALLALLLPTAASGRRARTEAAPGSLHRPSPGRSPPQPAPDRLCVLRT